MPTLDAVALAEDIFAIVNSDAPAHVRLLHIRQQCAAYLVPDGVVIPAGLEVEYPPASAEEPNAAVEGAEIGGEG